MASLCQIAFLDDRLILRIWLIRRADYDEDDDGFKFTRAQTKRAKPVPVVIQRDDIPHNDNPTGKPAVRRKSKRKSEEPNPSLSGDGEPSPKRATRRKKLDQPALSASPEQPAAGQDHEQLEVKKQRQNIQAAPHEPTKIALPFADTPIIRRNKAMRKGNTESRRSSLGMRGRRASSLIDSGTSNALPHDQVETADFYKHIESTLIEPRRMRQLLMWCGARALGNKPSFATDDAEVKLAAWEIQQELLKDFASKTELSDWFSRVRTSSAYNTKR